MIDRSSLKTYGSRMIAVLLASAIFGYGELYALADFSPGSTNQNPVDSANSTRHIPYGDLLEKHKRVDREALRLRVDTKRHRFWVLTLEDVYVYDTRTLELIRRIRLPDWYVADIMCPPDMALDQRGNAFVSNNVQPRLLQIDSANFQKKERELTLISRRKGWEIGFGGLAFGSDGTLFALTALGESLFKIDLASGTAREIVLSQPMARRCALMSIDQIHPRAHPRTE